MSLPFEKLLHHMREGSNLFLHRFHLVLHGLHAAICLLTLCHELPDHTALSQDSDLRWMVLAVLFGFSSFRVVIRERLKEHPCEFRGFNIPFEH